jgi:hypothetical protein
MRVVQAHVSDWLIPAKQDVEVDLLADGMQATFELKLSEHATIHIASRLGNLV